MKNPGIRRIVSVVRRDVGGRFPFLTQQAVLAKQRKWSTNVASLCHGLGRLLSAGLTLPTALECLETAPHSKPARAALQAAKDGVRHGMPLSMAWRDVGSPLFLALLQASEISGQLPDMLHRWYLHIDKQNRRTKELVKLCGYPALVMCSNVSLLLFVSQRVLPTFQELDRQFGTGNRYDHVTVIMDVLRALPVVLVAAFCSVVISIVMLKLGVHRPSWLRRIVRWIPGGSIHRLARTSTFCLLLSTLMSAGIPLVDGLKAMAEHEGPRWLKEAALLAHQKLLLGERVMDVFQGDWDPVLPVMLGWAEYTGELAEALSQVQEMAYQALMEQVQGWIRVCEPLILIVLGALVLGTMAVIFVPLYDQLTAIEGQGMG